MTQPAIWTPLLEQLLAGEALSASQAAELMQGWLAETIEPVLTGALLTALRLKGASGEELAAMASVLLEACAQPAGRPDRLLVDTCGTGGSGADSFNISSMRFPVKNRVAHRNGIRHRS